jgi:CheY-like chemotaxis protein
LKHGPFHILLADDDEADRLLFTDAFSELKIETVVQTVNNGVQLMEYLRKKEKPLPQLLFLDLNMPRKNGLQCLMEIRGNEKLKDISVAIYSTSNSEKDIEETFLHGANIYIHKPADFNILKQVLEKAVRTTIQYKDETMNRDNFLLRIQ